MGIFRFRKPKERKETRGVGETNFPRHIAIIMDGNGRWAKKRGLPRTAGHAVGAEVFRKIADYCKAIGVQYLTVYAWSTENWKRPQEEIQSIEGLLEKYLQEAVDTMVARQTKLLVMGDLSPFSKHIQELAAQTAALSDTIDGVQATICVNYGGRDEILRAARAYAREYAQGTAPELTEESFRRYLYMPDLPDPDLLIRPSGELRFSNFLLWQTAYTEFYFTDVLWPDFDEAELDKAIVAYQKRNRRFGGLR